MPGLFADQSFPGFGPHGLFPETVIEAVIHSGRASRLRARVRHTCPRSPGVYGMVDGAGTLIYVGKAKNLRARLLSYFRPRSRDPKAGHILRETRHLAWETGTSEFGALLRELELIRRWQPRFNVRGQPRQRRRVYVCVGRPPAAHVFTASRPPKTASIVYGPLPAGKTVREAVRRVNDLVQLRDCPRPQTMIFADERELFALPRAAGCIRHEIGSCLAPCAAVCSRADYAAAVDAARSFLDGADLAPLDELERSMREAAAACQFDRAVILRDKWQALRWLSRHLERLREATQRSLVYTLMAPDGREFWYLIRRGRVIAALPKPRKPEERQQAARRIEGAFAPGRMLSGPLSLAETDGVLLVASWFRRHPGEQTRTLTPAAALSYCRENE